MTTIKGFLIERDGRSLFMRELQEWVTLDTNYNVTVLVAQQTSKAVWEEDLPKEVPTQPQTTDDTQERIQLMNELFDLQQTEIDQLKQRLEAFVEVVEGIAELTEVVSQSAIENRSKLLIISDSCKKILAPQE